VPHLNWQACGDGFFCATADVPLDYAHPAGATIRLAVIKHPATDPAHRIGSLFFNPGGPGGPGYPGVTVLPLVCGQLPPAIRARFDVISFDPRGPTTAQSLILDPEWGKGKDAPVVARLKRAGAVITGSAADTGRADWS
jgi:hypothetical protein